MNTLNESLMAALIADKMSCFDDDEKPEDWLDREIKNLSRLNELDLLRAVRNVDYTHQFCRDLDIDIEDFKAWNRVMSKLAFRQG